MIDDEEFTSEQLLLTFPQAAKVLGVGLTTVYRLVKEGDVHSVHIGRSSRITWAEMERYLTRLEAPIVEPPAPEVIAERRWRRVTMPAGARRLIAVEEPELPAM